MSLDRGDKVGREAHPLPWTMPDRDNWVNLEPELVLHEGEPKPYKLRLGSWNSTSATFSKAELRTLRDRINAALAAPFLVVILGGEIAEAWMVETVDRRLSEVLQLHPDLVVSHAGRPGSADDVVTAWAEKHDVSVRVDPAGIDNGGSAALVFMTGTGERNSELMTATHVARIPTWQVGPAATADRRPFGVPASLKVTTVPALRSPEPEAEEGQ